MLGFTFHFIIMLIRLALGRRLSREIDFIKGLKFAKRALLWDFHAELF